MKDKNIFSYQSVNDCLFNHHPNLSSYWATLSFDENFAYVTYDFEDGSDATVKIDKKGKVHAPKKVMNLMKAIG